MSTVIVQAQSYLPLGYWRFSSGSPLLDTSGNNHPININVAQVNTSNSVPIAGNYLLASNLNATPGVTGNLDNGSAGIEVSIELWVRVQQGTWIGDVFWDNKCQLEFADNYLNWYVYTGNGQRVLSVPLLGIGAADPHRLLDQKWHHVAAVYSSKTGEQRIYIDGICPPGFSVHHNSGGVVNDGGNLHFHYNGASNHLVADIDEFAAYDTVIPPQLVWEHYQAGLVGQPYQFVQQSAVATYPFPSPVEEKEINLLEFAAGYPNVPDRPLELFKQYQHARYAAHDSIRPLMSWMADVNPFYTPSSLAQSNLEARRIFERLAHDWNYYLYAGGLAANYDYLRKAAGMGNDSIYFPFHVIEMLNDPANAGLSRSLITYWGQATESRWNDGDTVGFRRSPYILSNSPLKPWFIPPALPDTFYFRDSTLATTTLPYGPLIIDGNDWARINYAIPRNPLDARFLQLRTDGIIQRAMLDTFFVRINDDYIDFVGENDEVLGLVQNDMVLNDREANSDFVHNFPGFHVRSYQGVRMRDFRNQYQDFWRNEINIRNGNLNRGSVETWWYDLAGDPYSYQHTRSTLISRDGLHRCGLHFYPNNPRFWRHGYTSAFGLDQTTIALYYQLQAGDSLFIPSVSPGFNDGGDWAESDSMMMRPGQFLGQLKALTCMGAESFIIFMYQAGAPPRSDGNWRTWHMPMLSYAQGITSRIKDFLYHGEVLFGDTAAAYTGGFPVTFFTFSTGNNNDLITGRKLHGQQVYLLSASAQRTSNMQSQVPKEKPVSFKFHNNQGATLGFSKLTINERLQGSMYILDRSVPTAPVFYQLDRWHEWKEPSRWCHDFSFEAEVWDSAVGSPSIVTERPVPATSGDFTAFTSFVRNASPGGRTMYRFKPVASDQSHLYLWVRARNNGTVPLNVSIRMDNGAPQLLRVTPSTNNNWEWYGADNFNVPIDFNGLDTTAHWLDIGPQNTQLDLDKVVLMRSPFSALSPFSIRAIVEDSVLCLGDTAKFEAEFGGPPTCLDVVWDFGDGTVSYGSGEANCQNSPICLNDWTEHKYQYPGVYQVIVTVSNDLFEGSASDTMYVYVGAPQVSAGPDTLVCRGRPVVLQGEVGPNTTYAWEVPLHSGQLSNLTVLNPTASSDSSQFYYLSATDTAGCSMTDSVWVTAVGLDSVAWLDTVWACAGQPVQLVVDGAFFVDWDIQPGLSNYHIANPIASPTSSTTYYFVASDVCRCDTIKDSIHVVVRGIVQNDTTVCLGTQLNLQTTGPGPWLWLPTGETTSSIQVAPIVTTTYTVELDSTGGCNTDAVTITVLPWRCCDVPGVPMLFKPHTSAWWPQPGYSTQNYAYHIIDTLFVDQNISFSNMTFYMDSMAVVYVAPGYVLSTNNCTFINACDWMWSGIKLQGLTSQFNSSRDNFVNAQRGVWSRNGGPFTIAGSLFKSCWVGVFVGPYGYQSSPGSLAHTGQIEGTIFTSIGLIRPYANQPMGWAGVQCDSVGQFTLGVIGGQANRFERIQHGLLGIKSGLTVNNNRFATLQRGTVAPYFGLGAGVASLNSTNNNGSINATPSVIVGHPSNTSQQILDQHANTFTGCHVGVYTQGIANVRVRGNTFQFNRTGTRIGYQNFNTTWVDYNLHENDSLAILFGFGLRIQGHAEYNKITGTSAFATAFHHGIRCENMVFNANPVATYPFRLYENRIRVHGNGIWVQTGNKMDITQNNITIEAQQPNDRLRAIFVNSSPKARIYRNFLFSNALGATLTQVEAIHVFSSPESNVTCNESTRFGQHVVFEGDCNPSNFLRNEMTDGVSGLVYVQFGRIGAQGNLSAPSDNQWLGSFTYSHTLSISSFGTQSQLFTRASLPFEPMVNRNFLGGNAMIPDNSALGPLGSCAAVPIAPSKLQALVDLASINQLTTSTDSAADYRAKEWAYEELLVDSSLVIADTLIQQLKDSLEWTDLGAASRANVDLQMTDTTMSLLETQLLNPSSGIAENHRQVLLLRLDSSALDSMAIAQLLQIAGQCEDLGGKGVNLARSILATEGIYLWDDPDCEPALPETKKRSGNESASGVLADFECWPNPSAGLLYLRSTNGIALVDLKVWGSNGQVLLAEQREIGPDASTIDTQHWAQGLIVVQLRTLSGKSLNWRVMIQR